MDPGRGPGTHFERSLGHPRRCKLFATWAPGCLDNFPGALPGSLRRSFAPRVRFRGPRGPETASRGRKRRKTEIVKKQKKIEGAAGWSTPRAASSRGAKKKLRFRFFVVFGLWGPFLGPGAFKNEPRMKNCVGWTPGGVRGPILSGFRSGGGRCNPPSEGISH